MAPKSKHELQKERERFKAHVEQLIKEHDIDSSRSLEVKEIELLLEDLDGAPPLKRDVDWVMTMGDKDKSGSIQSAELFVVLNKYARYREEHKSLIKLIEKHDIDHNQQMDSKEMKNMLSELYQKDITEDDVKFVQDEYDSLTANSSSKNVKDKENIHALAKAISLWEDQQADAGGFLGLPFDIATDTLDSWGKGVGKWGEGVGKWSEDLGTSVKDGTNGVGGLFACCGDRKESKAEPSPTKSQNGQYV